VFSANQWVRIGYVQWVHKYKSPRAETLPEAEISLPISRIHGDNNLRVEHVLEVLHTNSRPCSSIYLSSNDVLYISFDSILCDPGLHTKPR